jgi:hypothetical protein
MFSLLFDEALPSLETVIDQGSLFLLAEAPKSL